MTKKIKTTAQENFWAGEFGDDYISRNNSHSLLQSNIDFFKKSLRKSEPLEQVLELGCNIGMNLKALNAIMPKTQLTGVDVNAKAVEAARKALKANIFESTIIQPLRFQQKFDLVFTKTVLIHIHPQHLKDVYENLFSLSSRYVLVAEYYNPSPVEVEYRGHKERLFKRDFAGELIDTYPFQLIDYGFVYKRDSYAPQDDINWFLLEKCETI
jgi:pseudaminic acid biosynthesis-associated methylase